MPCCETNYRSEREQVRCANRWRAYYRAKGWDTQKMDRVAAGKGRRLIEPPG